MVIGVVSCALVIGCNVVVSCSLVCDLRVCAFSCGAVVARVGCSLVSSLLVYFFSCSVVDGFGVVVDSCIDCGVVVSCCSGCGVVVDVIISGTPDDANGYQTLTIDIVIIVHTKCSTGC